MTWKDKKETWDKVAQEFQALGGGDRTSSVLRNKHEGIKQALKAKLARNKVELFKTVEGSAQIADLTDYENELMEHSQLNVNGLPAMFDSDRILTGTVVLLPLMGWRRSRGKKRFSQMDVEISRNLEAVFNVGFGKEIGTFKIG
ncbi:Myb/SANT-like DNA-binding domain [Popillia japonica]|uniref:Regulatory protein zeste n=1 Tax=Popillia japonica TaxID=7064 RepID=A0AAW1J0C3_POPJA